ncbi:CDP-diacylglycerol diphosphatase [Bordetella sp. FB-8]|uniref:CDP-diacylglycerol diphosphatase n=1 Tax=Bordetella sp. FB-8 TaxID=1159870 RepID=UPI000360D1BC|nr:CDP-diacylglycerol diphosphatase [Bordetella sp. FB-8]
MSRMSASTRRILQAATGLAITAALLLGCQAVVYVHNPDALWQIVSQSCVPSDAAGKGPGKCAKVSPDGYALLKDIRGQGQYLLIPTARVAGMESPALSQPGAPDYFLDAWENRDFVSKALDAHVPDALMSLAINSAKGRSQNQLHIHIDCMSQAMRNALSAYDDAAPGTWVDARLNNHFYRLMRVASATAKRVHPYDRVLKQAEAQGQAIGDHAIFMATAPGGFFVVDGYYQARGQNANPGSAEELQDHSCKDVGK